MKSKRDTSHARAIERREFLGVGAAMGAAAYLGVEEEAAAANASDAPVQGVDCATTGAALRWSIPTKRLSTLWSALWPRMAARIWMDPALDWPNGVVGGDFIDIGPELQKWIESFVGRSNVPNPVSAVGEFKTGDPGPNPQSLTNSKGDSHSTAGSVAFSRALRELHRYLSVPPGQGRAPIYLLGRGGYDFLVSEKGVELWAPPSVTNDATGRRDLLNAYEYRRTGRPPLAIADVMEGAVNLPDSPMGPGQIEAPFDPTLLEAVCMDTEATNPLEYCGALEGAQAWLETLSGGGGVQGDIVAQLRRGLRALGATPEDIAAIVRSADPIGEASRWLAANARLGDEACVPLSEDLYYCKTLTRRCWVVTGTVFRGILEQFPRAVADVWSDAPGTDIKTVDVREACEERMEVRFPPRMRFEYQDAAISAGLSDPLGITTPPPLPDPRHFLWDPQHLMITNTGFLFPARIGNAGVAGSADDLLNAIVTGRAGNPVFTDTSACM